MEKIKVPKYKIPNKLFFIQLIKTIYVTAEEYLTLCCDEKFNYLVIKDINQYVIIRTWYSEIMKGMKKKYFEYKPVNKEVFEISHK